MTEYLVFVESSDYFTVEADNPDEAKDKAVDIASSCSLPSEWKATIVTERDADE